MNRLLLPRGARYAYVLGDTIVLLSDRNPEDRRRWFFPVRTDAESWARELRKHYARALIAAFPEGSAARDVIVVERV